MTTIPKVLKTACLLLALGFATDLVLDTDLVVREAEARVGRPLTPVSVAGVARRTTRRRIRRTAAYVATLPRGCRTVVIEGMRLYQCGPTYYQASGTRYIVVTVR